MQTVDQFASGADALFMAIEARLGSVFTALPAILSQDSADGHTAAANSALLGLIYADDGTTTTKSLPGFDTMPIHFPGSVGAGVVSTHPHKAGDEGIAMFFSRALDSWHQSGGVQAPIDSRIHNLSDAVFMNGLRSDPNKLANVSNGSLQHRSIDGKTTHDVSPAAITHKVVDPSDSSSNPFSSATIFHQTLHSAVDGILKTAKDATNNHTMKLQRVLGLLVSVITGSTANHSVNLTPSGGFSASASDPTAGTSCSIGASPSGVLSLVSSLPSGGLSLPSGSITAGALAAGAAGPTNVFSFLSDAQITDVTSNTCSLDVSSAINSGIGSAPGLYYFPAGTYGVSSPLVINTGQYFVGAGVSATTLKVLGPTATAILQSFDYLTLVGTGAISGPYNFGFRDMTFDGSKAAVSSTANNINLYGFNFTVSNILTRDSTAHGWYSQWANSGTVPVGTTGLGMESHVTNLISVSNTAWGVQWCGPHDSILSDLIAYLNGGGGIGLATSATYDGGATLNTVHSYGNADTQIYANGIAGNVITITGTTIQGDNGPAGINGIEFDTYSKVWASNISAYLNGGTGVAFRGNDGTITGVTTSGNTGAGIVVDGSFNMISAIHSVFNATYGLTVSVVNGSNAIVGAIATNNTTANYNVAAGNNISSNY